MRHRLAILLISLGYATTIEASPKVETVPGEILVRWKRPLDGPRSSLPLSATPTELRATDVITRELAGYRVRGGLQLDRRTELLRIAPAATAGAIETLRRRPDVELAEPNYLRRRFAVTPNDEHYPLQWYLGAAKIEQAWNIATGVETSVVAVIDTGIRREHPDLAGRLLPGYDFIDKPEDAGDGDGRDPDPQDEGTNGRESSGQHGTHVAGIIAAVANNSKGIAGINWRAKVLPIRALGIRAGVGNDADISAAIRWAAGLDVPGVPPNPTPAKVINLSFGSPGYGRVLSDAIGAAMQHGVVVVAAAGNDTVDAKDIYPAAVPGVLTVGATDYDGRIAPYSNFGKVVDIVAPGGYLGMRLPFSHQDQQYNAGIISTMYEADTGEYIYHLTEGTSQATPIVAGVISLMAALAPDIDQKRAAEILLATADPNGRCTKGCGAGALNAHLALSTLAPGGGTDPELPPGDVYGVTCAASPAGGPAGRSPSPPWLLLALLALALLARRRARSLG